MWVPIPGILLFNIYCFNYRWPPGPVFIVISSDKIIQCFFLSHLRNHQATLISRIYLPYISTLHTNQLLFITWTFSSHYISLSFLLFKIGHDLLLMFLCIMASTKLNNVAILSHLLKILLKDRINPLIVSAQLKNQRISILQHQLRSFIMITGNIQYIFQLISFLLLISAFFFIKKFLK